MLLVDASASMAYPVPSLAKWNYARHLALGLAAAAHQTGDPIGLVVAGGGRGSDAPSVRTLPARTRRGVVHEIASVLRDTTPGGSAVLAPRVAALRGSGRVVIISDFLCDADAMAQVAGQLAAQGREVYAIHVIHETELHPPRGQVLFQDPEAADFMRPMDEGTRAQYLSQFSEWCDTLAREWVMRGAYYAKVVTDEPVAVAVRRITRPAGAR
jgi:uncharacterized protein (DUF58 family)